VGEPRSLSTARETGHGGLREDRKHEIPFRVLLKSREPFACVELWEENKDSDGHPIQTFAIITTEANAVVAPIYTRMPVLLRRQTEHAWLARDYPPCMSCSPSYGRIRPR
jgi:putative SOS response-associated peptidase YedK